MVKAPHRRRKSRVSANAASVTSEPGSGSVADRARSLTRLSKWLVPGGLGLMIGLGIAAVYFWLLTSESAAQREKSFDNATLVTQQLDELFNVVEQRLDNDEVNVELYRDLLDIYRIYDGLFITQNSDNQDSQLASAYAAKRMGHASLALGEFQPSLTYYRQARSDFGTLSAKHSGLMGLYAEWISAQIQIIYVEMETRNLRFARAEYVNAIRMLEQTELQGNVETYRWMDSRLTSLIEIGVQLGLIREANTVAKKLVRLTQDVIKKHPNNADLAKRAQELKYLLERLRRTEATAT